MYSMKTSLKALAAVAVSMGLFACGGGGGGGGGYSGGSSSSTLYYPYEDVYGDVCTTVEPTPGCTFDRATGLRITVESDSGYDRYYHGSDDLGWVEFDASGYGRVYSANGTYLGLKDVSQFAGYVGGTYIGVGTTGLFWEDIRNGTYWIGDHNVLYSANAGEGNYGKAINNETAGSATDTDFAAINSDSNKRLVKRAAAKLVKEYGFKQDKAVAVASALNTWAVAGVERGHTTAKDISKTFQSVFGVSYKDALAAVTQYATSNMKNTDAMQKLTNRSAAALGLKPSQAQKFMKGMYKKALAEFGYDVNAINW